MYFNQQILIYRVHHQHRFIIIHIIIQVKV